MALLQLEEILWEITNKCNKKCTYCGSSDIINTGGEPTKKELDLILENINNVLPKEVTITGGEPGCVEGLMDIFTGLHPSIKLKAVTNGHLLEKLNTEELAVFSQIGISVNTVEEIEDFIEKEDTNVFAPYYYDKYNRKNNITMITNFGKHNIWNFNDLYTFFKAKDYSLWQIQLTMGPDMLPADGIKHLRKKISEIHNFGAEHQPYILADNLQLYHQCQAGIRGCSITYKGEIIPCLSERSWKKDLRVQGKITDRDSLHKIWENSFKDLRFKKGKCCRDCIAYPGIDDRSTESSEMIKKIERLSKGLPSPSIPSVPSVLMYGVGSPDPGTVFVYGTAEPFKPFKTGDLTGDPTLYEETIGKLYDEAKKKKKDSL